MIVGQVICIRKTPPKKLTSTILDGVKYSATDLFHNYEDREIIKERFSMDLYNGENLEVLASGS